VTELFGVSMNLIMYVLVAALGVALATVAYVWLRNRVMFNVGVRNIPRRTAQTTLIVLGLMLSSLIISAAFTMGDTVSRSLTSQVYSLLGSVDETVQVQGSISDQTVEDEDAQSIQRDEGFATADAQRLIDQLEGLTHVDAVVPMFAEVAVAVNPEQKLSSPTFTVVGIDAQASRNLPDIQDVKSGQHLNVADLGPNEIYVTRSGASDLNVKPGQSISVNAFGMTKDFTVKAIVEDRRLAGSGGISVRREGGVVPLPVAQGLFDAPGRLTSIAISNEGDVHGGVQHSDEVTAAARDLAHSQDIPFSVLDVKKQGVDLSEQASSGFTTFFLVFGLFSIGAGVLLIFMIFVMLAAERKSEMGMARAIGTKRADLVQTFLAEGMGYNLAAAAVGCALGVGVAFVIARILASIFSNFDIDISPHVTARSLVVSYSLGVVLTFLTVVFSSWRISNINIVRAIRDIPDPPMQRPSWRVRGFWPTLVRLIFKPGGVQAVAIRIALFVVAIGLIFSGGAADGAVKVLIILAGSLLFLTFVFLTFQWGALFLAVGSLLTIVGASGTAAAPLFLGLSLLPIGLALLVRSFGANERLVYTLAGLALLYIWLFDFETRLIQQVFGQKTGDVEMFFLSGLMITVASVFLAVYNADLIVTLINTVGSRLGSLLPSIRMAVAYPLVNRMRTGMTMAMFCLVVFALIVMSTLIYNFNHVFISDRSLGGWDVRVEENPTNQIPDLSAALRQAGSDAPDRFQAVGVVSIAGRSRVRVCEPRSIATRCNADDLKTFDNYLVRGEDPGFFAGANVALQTRATGYESDAAVWQAVANDPTLAIVDSNALAGGGGFGGGGGGFLHSVDSSARTMEPTPIIVYDRKTQKATTVKVIGIIEFGSSNEFFAGIHVSKAAFDSIFGTPDRRSFFIKTKPGTDNRALARQIEAALLDTGAQADSLRYVVDQQSSLFTGFIRIIQGFMGLGLVVGVAAVGVIAFRTVVERRQQIGMLRALGYTRGMVGLTFLLESAFISIGGIGTGMGFGLVLARFLIRDQFANQGVSTFVIPYVQVLVIGGLALGAALLMTILPSRQASNIPIAAALRYE
jgi:putative ABC transport system permease protein